MDDVDGRLVDERGRRRDDFVLFQHFLRPRDRAADGEVGAAQDRAVGGTREQQPAREQRSQADQQRPRAAEELREPASQQLADEAAVLGAERHHQAGEREAEPGAKRLHVEQHTPKEKQPADGDEGERRDIRGRAQHVAEAGLDLLPHHAAFPAEIEQRGEEEPERSEAKPDQFRVLVWRT